jgi:hypothetical protein
MNTQAMRDVEVAFDDMDFAGGELWRVCLQDGGDRAARATAYQRYFAAIDVYEAKRDIVRNEWAQVRGWHYDAKKWGLHYPYIDHAEIFVDAAGRQVGTLSHTYASRPQIEGFAAKHGLCATFLETSWYAPGITTAVLFTRSAL